MLHCHKDTKKKTANLPKSTAFLRKSWIVGYKYIVIFTWDSIDGSGILMEIRIFILILFLILFDL